jgi:hypothetical protein
MADHQKAHPVTQEVLGDAFAPGTVPAIVDEVARQSALDALEILDTPPEERFDRITRLAKQLFGVETVAISLIDHDRQWLKSQIGTDVKEAKRNDSLCDSTIQGSGIFTIPDTTKDSRFEHNPNVVGRPNIRFYAGYPLTTSGREHVGALCIYDSKPRVFTEAEAILFRDLAIWVQKEMTIEKELSRAAQVQVGLLPKQDALLRGYEVAGACASAHTVGGDFYDWYPVDEGEAFTLADVMGKGIAAAIIAATVRAVLRAGSRDNDIIKAVEIAAATLEGDLNNADSFVTLFHARLNTTTGLVRYVDAGHGLSLLIRQDGSSQRLSSEDPPLGAGLDIPRKEQSFTLKPGDTLISVSDGVLDLFDGTLAGLDTVAKIVRSSASAQAAVDALMALTGHKASDDITTLVIRRLP